MINSGRPICFERVLADLPVKIFPPGCTPGLFILFFAFRIESPEALRANIPTLSLSVHTSATGKLLLAFMPEEEIIAYFPERLPAETPNSITQRDSLLDQLRLIRERHYAVDNQEGFEDVLGYAVPVVNQNDQIIAALSLVGPSSRISAESDEARAATLFRYAGLISRRLGCGRYPYGTWPGISNDWF